MAREKDATVLDAAKQGLLKLARETGLAAHWSFDDGNRKVAKDVAMFKAEYDDALHDELLGKMTAAKKFGEAERYFDMDRCTDEDKVDERTRVAAWMIYTRNHQRLEALTERVRKDAGRTTAMLDVIEKDPDLRDADKLARRPLDLLDEGVPRCR